MSLFKLERQGANAFRVIAEKTSPRLFDTINQFPGRKQRSPAGPLYELTIANLRHFTERHPDLLMCSALHAWYEEAHGVKMVARLDVTPDTFRYRMPPMIHQKTAMDRFWKSGTSYWGLFFEMGTGKTKTTIDLAGIKFLTGQIDTMLVIAPKGVHTQWSVKQIPEHMSPDVNFFQYLWRRSGSKSEVELREDIIKKDEDALRIVCMNIDALNSSAGFDFAMRFVKSGRCMMVVDESITIKNYRAQRTKNTVELGAECVARTILNGAPISNGPQDIFGQMLFLSASILGRSFIQFQHQFLVMGGFQGRQVVGHKNLEHLQQIIDKHCFRVLSADCIDLPEQNFMDRFVEMTDEQDEWYRKVKEDILVEMSNGDVLDTSQVTTRFIKLQQVCWGYIRDAEGIPTRIANNRVDAVIDILDETRVEGNRRTPTLVFCRFREEIAMIAERLRDEKISFREFHGGVSGTERDQACTDFQNGEFDVFIINSAGYRGLDLWRARQVIWYSLTFSLDEYSQANKRPHRVGQTYPVRYIHLISPGTLDVRLVKALHRKATVAEMLLDIRESL